MKNNQRSNIIVGLIFLSMIIFLSVYFKIVSKANYSVASGDVVSKATEIYVTATPGVPVYTDEEISSENKLSENDESAFPTSSTTVNPNSDNTTDKKQDSSNNDTSLTDDTQSESSVSDTTKNPDDTDYNNSHKNNTTNNSSNINNSTNNSSNTNNSTNNDGNTGNSTDISSNNSNAASGSSSTSSNANNSYYNSNSSANETTIRQTPKPTTKTTPKPTIKSTPKPTVKATAKTTPNPTTKVTPKPTTKTTPKPTVKPSVPSVSALSSEQKTMIQYVIDETNALRVSLGLNKLSKDTTLCNIAQYRSDYMAETGNFSHQVDGVNHYRVVARMFNYPDTKAIGENIGWCGLSKPGKVSNPHIIIFDGLVESPSHYENMTDSQWTTIGVGMVEVESTGEWYLTQIFGK